MPKPVLPDNSSFAIDKNQDKKDIVVFTGAPTIGADGIAIWFAATVDLKKRQTNIGTVRVLRRYALANLSTLPATGPTILHVDAGGTYNQVQVDGVPTSDQIRLHIGANVINCKHTGIINESVDQLMSRYLEDSSSN